MRPSSQAVRRDPCSKGLASVPVTSSSKPRWWATSTMLKAVGNAGQCTGLAARQDVRPFGKKICSYLTDSAVYSFIFDDHRTGLLDQLVNSLRTCGIVDLLYPLHAPLEIHSGRTGGSEQSCRLRDSFIDILTTLLRPLRRESDPQSSYHN
jgi:hypothetical protein